MITGMKSVVHAYLTACVGVVVNTTSMESDIHELHLALLASQRPQVPHLGGGGAHHVCHDAELRER